MGTWDKFVIYSYKYKCLIEHKLHISKHNSLLQADVDKNGTIDYIEFITATMHRHRLEKEDHLYKAFQYFDKDGSGYVP